MGGNRAGKNAHIRNLIITFTVSGFWHGANWTYIIWGFLNGIYYLPLLLRKKQVHYNEIVAVNTFLPSIKEFFGIMSTFLLILLSWVFFRANTLTDAIQYLGGIFDASIFYSVEVRFLKTLSLIQVFVFFEWIQRRKEHPLRIENLKLPVRWAFYFILSVAIIENFVGNKSFIYFQF